MVSITLSPHAPAAGLCPRTRVPPRTAPSSWCSTGERGAGAEGGGRQGAPRQPWRPRQPSAPKASSVDEPWGWGGGKGEAARGSHLGKGTGAPYIYIYIYITLPAPCPGHPCMCSLSSSNCSMTDETRAEDYASAFHDRNVQVRARAACWCFPSPPKKELKRPPCHPTHHTFPCL